jgi:hypothetical protein
MVEVSKGIIVSAKRNGDPPYPPGPNSHWKPLFTSDEVDKDMIPTKYQLVSDIGHRENRVSLGQRLGVDPAHMRRGFDDATRTSRSGEVRPPIGGAQND